MPESKTILLVEDEALIALHEKRILEQAGYRVVHVGTGDMAVSTACTQADPPIDLILMDIDLGPGIDGTQAAQQILARRDIPIIFISMHTEQEWVDKTEQITSYGYIVKGSGTNVLLASIKMAFKLRQAHARLHESEDRYRVLVENSTNSIGIHCEGKVVYANAAALKLFNANRLDDVLGMPVFDLVHPDYRAAALARVKATYEKQQFASTLEEKFITLDGKEIDVEVTGIPTEYHGKPATQLIMRDITQRKQTEAALDVLLVQVTQTRDEAARARDLLDAMMERISDGFVAFDKDFNYTYVNSYGAQLLGRVKEDLIGKNYWVEFPEARGTPFANAYMRAFETQQPVVFEDYYAYWDRWFSNRIYPSKEGITILFNDITERKRAEDQIKMLLSEKELLLKEVHHRIKNNMSTIISLLTLQASSLHDPASGLVLQDASSRVQSMMVLYDKLYQADNINQLSLREYVPALLSEVLSLFPQHETVTTEAQIEDIALSPRQVSPLGIILTELITNSMKYAFPNQRQGCITVLATQHAGQVTITYSDDGVGLPESFDIKRSPRFGMYLVDMLVSQLHGTITAEGQPGTRFVIRFSV